MHVDILRLATDFARRGEPFALAIVVRREAPSSARLGDTALITAAGNFHGWLGGSCTQPTAVREALQALAERTPRLIVLSPNPDIVARPGVTVLPMTCHSGGSVDIYIEPVLPAPRLLVFGVSPTAQALARMAKVLGYVVEVVDPEADQANFAEVDRIVTDLRAQELKQRSGRDSVGPYVVVATLGENDVDALRAALSLEPAYIGLVASRKRFDQLRGTLQAGGIAREAIELIKSPAGLDLGAVTPQEIALSILAEIVQLRGTLTTVDSEAAASASLAPERTGEQKDPVCGMAVDPETARYYAEFGGRTVYFCCGECREQFLADPARYAATTGARGAS